MAAFASGVLLRVGASRRTGLQRARALWLCTAAQPRPRARERRREVSKARTAAHLELKRRIDEQRSSAAADDLCTAYLSVSPAVIERCQLPAKLSRVKTVLPRQHVTDAAIMRRYVCGVLTRLYPELRSRGLLSDGGEEELALRGGGGRPLPDDATSDGPLFFEVELLRAPPPPRPRSARWHDCAERAKVALQDASCPLRMCSFYRFYDVGDAAATAALLKRSWGQLGALGRIYVAPEGVNAQMAVPAAVWRDFADMMSGAWREEGRTLVPDELLGVFLNVDSAVAASERPFDALHVRPRRQVLADGLERPLDWGQAGREVDPVEWHGLLDDQDAIVVDCRNAYETDVGRFEGAEAPDTQTFRDTWTWLERRLDKVNKDTPIMTYCTGGIRCVKVNSYLEQKMGFRNTRRLAGGIVSYARELESHPDLDSKFQGVNHVFDGRIGKSITADVMSSCVNCGVKSQTQTDCANPACPRSFAERLFVQCEDCAADLQGACCRQCYEAMKAAKAKAQAAEAQAQPDIWAQKAGAEERYADAQCAEGALLRELREAVARDLSGRAHMLSSPMQGALLAMLVRISGARRVLELGTFAGLSALHLAAALPDGGRLVSCDVDEQLLDVARAFVARSELAGVIDLRLAPADVLLRELHADGAEPFDLVFVDANKGAYQEYYDALLEGIVRPGGILCFDNTLFKGLVPQVAAGLEEEGAGAGAGANQELARTRARSLRKARKIASKLHEFNLHVARDERTEQVLLPVRDGLTIVRRR